MYMYKYNICIASLYSTRIYIVTNYSIDAVHTVIRTCQRSLALQQSNLTILMWDRVTLCETLYFYYGGTSTRWKFHLVEIPFSLPHTLHVYALISRPFVKTDLRMINNVAYCFTHCGGGGGGGDIWPHSQAPSKKELLYLAHETKHVLHRSGSHFYISKLRELMQAVGH